MNTPWIFDLAVAWRTAAPLVLEMFSRSACTTQSNVHEKKGQKAENKQMRKRGRERMAVSE